ncbi:universal stress protein [Trujillonella humicola]|uniref:universal stress protein n=1 Tax=Trujillonella humicola TaxID=3383699 RepID=UPI003905E65C
MSTPPVARPVLVGVDGSDGSRRAVAAGTGEARRRHAPLRLLAVTTWPARLLPRAGGDDGGWDDGGGGRGKDLGGLVRGATATLLRDLAADAADVLGADRVTWAVEDGDPVDVLAAAGADACLLVLGARGAGGVPGLLLGSTAAGLVAAAPCPVLVLPDESAVVVRERSSVVVGIEGRREDAEVLGFAVAEAVARATPLVAVHAWRDVTLETAFQSLGPLVDWAGVLADEERALAEALAGWREKEPDLALREVVVRDRAAPALVSAAMTAELLVVGHRHRRLLPRLGSTTSAVLQRAGCPVAVVPLGGRP